MAQKKFFKVTAQAISYSHIYVEAETKDEARDIAEDIDGGDFIPHDDLNEGEWNISTVEEATEAPPDSEVYTEKPPFEM